MGHNTKTEQMPWYAYGQVINLLVVALLVAFVLLYVNCGQRYNNFVLSQQQLVDSSAADTVKKLSAYIKQARQMVSVFAEAEAELLTQLSKNPQDDNVRLKVADILKRDISGYYSFTVADETGRPLLDDFDGEIGEVCLLDLKGFAEKWHPSEIFIHPNALQYHFDIMTLMNFDEGSHSIFFVSFNPDELVKILATGEISNYEIVLLHQSKNRLIELTSQGTRDILKRDINLSNDELNLISTEYDIPKSLWMLVYLPDETLFEEKKQVFRAQALMIFAAIFVFISALIVYVKRKNKNYMVN